MKKFKIIVFIILVVIQFQFFNVFVHAQYSDDNFDLEYILTIYYFTGNYEEVLRLLNRYYINYQRELSYLYGLCYLRLNMNRIALDYFYITLSDHENNYEVLNNIGVAYFNENDYVSAMKYFHLSFISNTDYYIAQSNYNTAYENWRSESENESIRAMIPFTEKPTIYSSLGWIYYYFGDFHNAIYYFSKAIEEDVRYQLAYIALAYIYHEGNNFETALNYLLEAEKINENNPDLYNNMGILYFHLDDYVKSENSFKKAISLNNKFAEPHNNLGFLFYEKHEYSVSREYFIKSIELNLDNLSLRAESFAGLALINFLSNNIEQSKSYKESSIRLDHRMNDARYLLNILKWSFDTVELWSKI